MLIGVDDPDTPATHAEETTNRVSVVRAQAMSVPSRFLSATFFFNLFRISRLIFLTVEAKVKDFRKIKLPRCKRIIKAFFFV